MHNIFHIFLLKNPTVVSRGPSLCLESAAQTQKNGTETQQNGSEELCAVRLESSAVPPSSGPDQSRQEENVKPGTPVIFPFLQKFQMRF